MTGAGAGLYFGLKIERRLSRARLYRIIRHPLRLVGVTVILVWFALPSGPLHPWPDPITLRWIDSEISPFQYVMIFAGIVIAHMVSRKMDYRTALEVDPVEAECREDDRLERNRRMRRIALITGTAGAIAVAVYGDPLGSIIFGFFAFGAAGVLVHLLYRLVTSPIRLMRRRATRAAKP